VTDLKHARPADTDYESSVYDVEAIRADLEQQRLFRVEQLSELIRDWRAEPAGALAEVTSALTSAAATALADIDAALHRIELGSFGRCRQCNRAIAQDRLKALPMASRCMFCEYAEETRDPGRKDPPDIVEIWGIGSFPASDPPANW
jgi:RNA polymerase-binding transcription factor DksA